MTAFDRRRYITIAVCALVMVFAIYEMITLHNLRSAVSQLRDDMTTLQSTCAGYETRALFWEEQYHDLYRMVKLEQITADEEEPVETVVATSLQTSASPADEEGDSWINIGNCRITHYCPCSKCCGQWANGITASGATAQEGRTVAVDSSVIPLGSEVLINGHVYIAEDTGVSGNAVDIYLDDHQRCLDQGMYYTTVKWRPANT